MAAELESNCFSFVREFFRCYGVLQNILDNDHVLEKYARVLSNGVVFNNPFQFFSNFDLSFKEAKNHNLALLKKEIEALYIQYMKTWETYRDVSGSFYLEYIREISGVSLKYL